MIIKTADAQANACFNFFLPSRFINHTSYHTQTHGQVHFIFPNLIVFYGMEKIKRTCPLAIAMPIRYSQHTIALLQFSFLFAFRKDKQKKTCSATTAKELFSRRSHFITAFSRLTPATLSAHGQAHFAFWESIYFQRFKKQKELSPLPACQANKEYDLISGFAAKPHRQRIQSHIRCNDSNILAAIRLAQQL